MRTTIRALLAAALLAGAGATPAVTEDVTSWRAGDRIAYRAGCDALDSIRAVVLAHVAGEAPPEVEGCFSVQGPRPLPAMLIERVSESIETPDGPVSLWRVLDALGDVAYIALTDRGGPHDAARPA